MLNVSPNFRLYSAPLNFIVHLCICPFSASYFFFPEKIQSCMPSTFLPLLYLAANLHLSQICPYHKQLFPSGQEYHPDISPLIEITLTDPPHSIHHPITKMKLLGTCKKVTSYSVFIVSGSERSYIIM